MGWSQSRNPTEIYSLVSITTQLLWMLKIGDFSHPDYFCSAVFPEFRMNREIATSAQLHYPACQPRNGENGRTADTGTIISFLVTLSVYSWREVTTSKDVVKVDVEHRQTRQDCCGFLMICNKDVKQMVHRSRERKANTRDPASWITKHLTLVQASTRSLSEIVRVYRSISWSYHYMRDNGLPCPGVNQ